MLWLFPIEAVELLSKINIAAWKIGSGEMNNPLILDSIKKTSLPILMKYRMSNWQEIDKNVLKLNKNSQICSLSMY